MKSIKQTFTITMDENQGYMDLTDDVRECVRRANIHDGLCVVNTLDTEASVFTCSNEPEDIQKYLDYYDTLLENADEKIRAALKHQMIGNGVTLTIVDGELDMGFSQYIIYADFSGITEKGVSISIIGE